MAKAKRTEAEIYAALVAKIPEFRLMDDTFMSAFFDGQIECTEFVLKIILQKDDLKVISAVAQKEIHSVGGHSVRLDVFASDSSGRFYDIEVQNADAGAVPRRARFNSAMLDAALLKKGEGYDKLPETYVIFITENDVLGGVKPLYHIERKITELDNKSFGDGQHIIYVNAAYESGDDLGRLMHDFKAKDPREMNYKILSERAKYLKSDGGGKSMCKIMDEFWAEYGEDLKELWFEKWSKEEMEKSIEQGIRQGIAQGREEERAKFVSNLLRSTNLSVEEISANSGLQLQEVKDMAQAIRQ